MEYVCCEKIQLGCCCLYCIKMLGIFEGSRYRSISQFITFLARLKAPFHHSKLTWLMERTKWSRNVLSDVEPQRNSVRDVQYFRY